MEEAEAAEENSTKETQQALQTDRCGAPRAFTTIAAEKKSRRKLWGRNPPYTVSKVPKPKQQVEEALCRS